jgi:hypothetical protein
MILPLARTWAGEIAVLEDCSLTGIQRKSKYSKVDDTTSNVGWLTDFSMS